MAESQAEEGGEAAAPAKRYEFSASDNQVIGELAAAMRFVAVGNLALGALTLAAGALSIFLGQLAPSAQDFVLGGAIVAAGLWIRSAAGSFQEIVDTQGYDIFHLMQALTNLRRVFVLQRALLIAAILMFVLSMAVFLFILSRA